MNFGARFLLEEKISDLWAVSVSDYDAILLREARDLSNRDGKIFELFIYRPAFAFADECVAAKRNQQNRPSFIFMS